MTEMSIDQAGNMPQRGNACVLLSGGLDSVVAMHWALSRYEEVRALGVDYGQPHRDAELTVAGKIARARGVPFETIAIADALHSGLLARVPADSEESAGNLHRAFVPGRNAVFIPLALARACGWWPGDFDIVIGANAEDAGKFPDCDPQFIRSATPYCSAATGRSVAVVAPWLGETKSAIILAAAELSAAALSDAQSSWSCYAGKGPCGMCTPCISRSAAFARRGIVDRSAAPTMFGGDVGRERGF